MRHPQQSTPSDVTAPLRPDRNATHHTSEPSSPTEATADPHSDLVDDDPAASSDADLDSDLNVETDADGVAGAVDRFVAHVTDALAAAEAPADTVAAVVDSGAQLSTQVRTASDASATPTAAADTADDAVDTDRIATLKKRITELESALAAERRERTKAAAEDRKRLYELETWVERRTDSLSDGESSEEGPQRAPDSVGQTHTAPRPTPAETPLEEVVRLPDTVAAAQLSANQRRARFIAKDVRTYTRRVPAGRALSTVELRRTLAANEETSIHSETVRRVTDFLDELGGESVTVRESRGGNRLIVFTPDLVDRIHAVQEQSTDHTVVTETEVERPR